MSTYLIWFSLLTAFLQSMAGCSSHLENSWPVSLQILLKSPFSFSLWSPLGSQWSRTSQHPLCILWNFLYFYILFSTLCFNLNIFNWLIFQVKSSLQIYLMLLKPSTEFLTSITVILSLKFSVWFPLEILDLWWNFLSFLEHSNQLFGSLSDNSNIWITSGPITFGYFSPFLFLVICTYEFFSKWHCLWEIMPVWMMLSSSKDDLIVFWQA